MPLNSTVNKKGEKTVTIRMDGWTTHSWKNGMNVCSSAELEPLWFYAVCLVLDSFHGHV